MNKEIQSTINNLQNVLSGEPWYGRPVYELLEETDYTRAANMKPGKAGHSALELLYHMLTWADFTLRRIEGRKDDMTEFEKLDWRTINPAEHTWEKGLSALKETHSRIIELLQEKDDSFLNEKADYRKYDFRFLLNGLVQHNIYHLGQIAYINKFLV